MSHGHHDDARGLMIGGFIVLGVGVFFLLRNFGIIPDLGTMWPIIPIIVGVAMLVGAFSRRGQSSGPA